MGHKAHTTSVVLVGVGIKTVILKVFDFGSRSHGALLYCVGKRSLVHRNNNAKKFNWGQILIKFSNKRSKLNKGHIKNYSYRRKPYMGKTLF
jgi:hypothetical protein